MVDTITLSVPAVDVLAEQLNLNIRQYPFMLPRLGESQDERQRLVEQVADELAASGLADARGPQPEVEDALYLLCSSEVAIAAAGVLDLRTGQPLAARVVATGEVGLVGVLDGRNLRMEFLAPDDLPGVCADLLPDAPPGAGGPVRAVAGDAAGPGREHARSGADGLRDLRAIVGRPKFRIGHYLVTTVDRRGRRGRLPGLTWFDNDIGRYLLLGDAGGLTCLPVDKGRIADQIGSLLGRSR
jgi:hypothetical protein